jgi:PEP-CTERM motif
MKQLLFAATLLVGCASVRADIIFTLGNHPQPDEENVLLTSGSGTTITGTTNLTGFSVLFSSSQTLLAPSSGQARVSANPEGSPLTNLSIAVDGGDYGDIILNPFFGSCLGCVAGDATVTVSALDSNGLPEAPSIFTYALGNGQNFLTIVASNGESIMRTTIDAPGGFHDLRQPRISGAEAVTSPVPEPATITLMGLGIVGMAFLLKFRKSDFSVSDLTMRPAPCSPRLVSASEAANLRRPSARTD